MLDEPRLVERRSAFILIKVHHVLDRQVMPFGACIKLLGPLGNVGVERAECVQRIDIGDSRVQPGMHLRSHQLQE